MKRKSEIFRLDIEGRRKILEFLQDFEMDGYISDIKVRRVVQTSYNKKGTVTFGITLRGFTAGNIDLEVPLTFDVDTKEMSNPAVAFVDGEAVLITQSLFDNILERYNMKRKFHPGWMNRDNYESPATYFIYNNYENRYSSKIDKRELKNAVSCFLINLLSGSENVKSAFNKSLKKARRYEDEKLLNLLLAFGSRVSSDSIINVYENNFKNNLNINNFIRERKAQEDEFEEAPAEEYELLEEVKPEEQAPAPTPEGEIEVKDIDIIVPEVYDKVVYPEARDLLELIRLYRIIRFTYRKLNDEWVMRTTDPHYLWLTKKGNIICIAWDYYRDDWRAFDINRMKDVNIYYRDEWIELGKFLKMLEEFREQGFEVEYNYNDIFSPRGPYYDTLVYVRGNLQKMNKKFGDPLHTLVESMIEKFDIILGR
jgi:hypothetical protein